MKHDDLTLYLPVGELIVGAIRCGAREDGRSRCGLVNLEKGLQHSQGQSSTVYRGHYSL